MSKTPTGDGGAREAEVLATTDAIESAATDAPLDLSTLVGDLRDFVLNLFKNKPKTWKELSNAEQRDLAAATEHTSREIIERIVDLIRTDGKVDPIKAILESYAEKDGIKAVVKIKAFDEVGTLAAVAGLHKAVGKMVLLTPASAEDYRDQREEPEFDADQPDLEFDPGSDRPAPDFE